MKAKTFRGRFRLVLALSMAEYIKSTARCAEQLLCFEYRPQANETARQSCRRLTDWRSIHVASGLHVTWTHQRRTFTEVVIYNWKAAKFILRDVVNHGGVDRCQCRLLCSELSVKVRRICSRFLQNTDNTTHVIDACNCKNLDKFYYSSVAVKNPYTSTFSFITMHPHTHAFLLIWGTQKYI